MKPPFSVVALLLLSASLFAASTRDFAHAQGTTSESLEGVTSISMIGVGNATVSIGAPASLTISGPREALDQIEVRIEGDKLEIRPEPGSDIAVDDSNAILFAITVESLEDLFLQGSVSLESTGISTQELDVELQGAATARLAGVTVEEIDVNLRGASLLEISGAGDELDIEVREAATFDGSRLIVESADVEARDAGHAKVHVTGSLEADARAAAVIEYAGDPQTTEFSMSDAATIIPLELDANGTPVATPVVSAVSVDIANFAFDPPSLEISIGEIVTWTNTDDAKHTVTADGGEFSSGELETGMSFSHTFEQAGEFSYTCAFHPNMRGTIVVTGN